MGGDPCRGFDSWRSASNSSANVSAHVGVLQTQGLGGGGSCSVRVLVVDRGGGGGGSGSVRVLVAYPQVHFSMPLMHVEQAHELHRWIRDLNPRVEYWHSQSPLALSAAQQFSPLHPRQSHGRGRSSTHSPSIVAASIVAADGPD